MPASSSSTGGGGGTRGRRAGAAAVLRRWLGAPWRGVRYARRAAFRATAAIAAAWLSAVLADPAVNRAAAMAIREGMNLFLTQPHLKRNLIAFQQRLATTEPSLAKAAGENFPNLLLNFFSGLVLQDFDGAAAGGADEGESQEAAAAAPVVVVNDATTTVL